MPSIHDEAVRFRQAKDVQSRMAQATAAAFLSTGLDLPAVLAAGPSDKNAAALRLRHRMERERQKGMSGHWGYDLNRHIALMQAHRALLEGSPSVHETKRARP